MDAERHDSGGQDHRSGRPPDVPEAGDVVSVFAQLAIAS
jgi:hypothetical protein